MSYTTITRWKCEKWDESMMTLAQEKYVPLVLFVGARRVQMLQTGPLSFSVVTEYADAATADAAQAKVAEIRAQAAEELPMKMEDAEGGEVFASG